MDLGSPICDHDAFGIPSDCLSIHYKGLRADRKVSSRSIEAGVIANT